MQLCQGDDFLEGIFERSYGRAFKVALKAVNPIKKKVLKTECLVHKFINHQSVIILKNDG
jgi:phospholipase C